MPQKDNVIDVAQGKGVSTSDLSEYVADVVQSEVCGAKCLAASIDRQICHIVQIDATTYRGSGAVIRSQRLDDGWVVVAVMSVIAADVVGLVIGIVCLDSVSRRTPLYQDKRLSSYPSNTSIITA